jgi:hypothetical protein
MTRLLRFPYPYRAALAIASDADDCGPERFLQIHRHLNEQLGLDVAGSFFLTAAPGQLNWRDHRDVVIEGLRRGWLDTIHGIGDFNGRGGFRREMAAEGLGALKGAGWTVEVFSNHGDAHNAQNLMAAGGRGDVPGAEEYWTDLMIRHGVRFVWPTWLTHLIGQDRDADAMEWTWNTPGASAARRFGATVLAAIGFVGFADPYPGNELVRRVTLGDGASVYAFRRYGLWRRDDVPALRELIAPERIRRLVERGGAAIVYTHLGRNWSPIPEFEKLKAFPELWIVRTSRLLRAVAVRDGLRWKAKGDVVTIEPYEDPVLGPIEPRDLAGIAFEGAEKICYGERELSVLRPGPRIVQVAP